MPPFSFPAMLLHLHNKYNNKEYDLPINAISVASRPDIYQFAIIMPQGADFGEYDYKLFQEEGDTAPIETGLLKYRPDERENPVEYTAPKTYEQYNPEI